MGIGVPSEGSITLKEFCQRHQAFTENTSERDSNCEQNRKCLQELSKLIRKIKSNLGESCRVGEDGS